MVQQVMTQLRRFAGCMRSGGVPNWPDPTVDPQGRPAVVIRPWEDGFDPNAPQTARKVQIIQKENQRSLWEEMPACRDKW